jgi:hypothetical protein
MVGSTGVADERGFTVTDYDSMRCLRVGLEMHGQKYLNTRTLNNESRAYLRGSPITRIFFYIIH